MRSGPGTQSARVWAHFFLRALPDDFIDAGTGDSDDLKTRPAKHQCSRDLNGEGPDAPEEPGKRSHPSETRASAARWVSEGGWVGGWGRGIQGTIATVIKQKISVDRRSASIGLESPPARHGRTRARIGNSTKARLRRTPETRPKPRSDAAAGWYPGTGTGTDADADADAGSILHSSFLIPNSSFLIPHVW